MRGWLRVVPFNDPRLSLLLRLPSWWLRPGAESKQPVIGARAVQVEAAKPHGAQEIVAKLEGIDDRDAASALEGAEILLQREQFPEPEPDEVYWADLIGCTVLDPDGAPLGTIVAIEDQPAHPVLRLSGTAPENDSSAPFAHAAAKAGERATARRPARRTHETLVPLVPELILEVDLARRVVVADWRSDY